MKVADIKKVNELDKTINKVIDDLSQLLVQRDELFDARQDTRGESFEESIKNIDLSQLNLNLF